MDLPAASIPSCEQSLTSPPLVVLDTNAVLDWLLFGDPGMVGLAAAVEAGEVRWASTSAMRAEFDEVLRRGLGQARAADAERIERAWRFGRLEPPAPAAALRCTDPDDQKFVDLALAVRARWLVSRDKALLKLGRQAALQGLAILTPPQWAAPAQAPR